MSFGIVIENPKHEVNIGTLFRSANVFGASCLCLIGRRKFVSQASDTLSTHRHIPLFRFDSWEHYGDSAPYSWEHVGVECDADAIPLPRFSHPRTCMYVLGPEDGGLSNKARSMCRCVVVIPSARCLNLAVAGSIVMYDRTSKKEKTV